MPDHFPSDDFIIRSATPDERQAIFEMLRNLRDPSWTQADLEEDADLYADPESELKTFIACKDGFAVGLAALRPRPEDNGGFINSLYVHENWRGHGIGRVLMQHCEDWTRQAGLRSSGLGVDSLNEGAIRLYQSLGYKTVFNSVCGSLGETPSRSDSPFTMRRADPSDWPAYSGLQIDPSFVALLSSSNGGIVGEHDFQISAENPQYPTQCFLMEKDGVPLGTARLAFWTRPDKNYKSYTLYIGVIKNHPDVRSVLDQNQAQIFVQAMSDCILSAGRQIDYSSQITAEQQPRFASGTIEITSHIMDKTLTPRPSFS